MTHPLPQYPQPYPDAPVTVGVQSQLRIVGPADDDRVPDTHDVQAAAEGVVEFDDTNSIEFMGKRFGLAQSIGLMPLLKFAHAAKTGLTSDDMEGLNAMYLLIRSCLDRSQAQAVDGDGKPQFDDTGAPIWAGPSQWDLFEVHAIEVNAEGEDLSELINKAVQIISARPSVRRGASSPSSPQTSPNSKASSSSPVTRPAPPGFEQMTAVADLGRQDR